MDKRKLQEDSGSSVKLEHLYLKNFGFGHGIQSLVSSFRSHVVMLYTIGNKLSSEFYDEEIRV